MEEKILDNNLGTDPVHKVNQSSFDERVQDKIQNGYTFKFGEYISDGFRIFGQKPGMFIGYTLVYILIMVVLSVIPLVGGIARFLLSAPLAAGFYIVAQKTYKGENVEFSNFFDGFSKYGNLLLASFLVGLITVFGLVLLVFPGIFLSVALSFTSIIVIFTNKSGTDAINLSFKIILKNWFPMFGFLIVLSLINMVGALALGIGLFVTIPASIAAIYVAYEDIIGTRKNEM